MRRRETSEREREREYTLLIKYVGKMEHSLSFCFVFKVKKLLHDALAPKKIRQIF